MLNWEERWLPGMLHISGSNSLYFDKRRWAQISKYFNHFKEFQNLTKNKQTNKQKKLLQPDTLGPNYCSKANADTECPMPEVTPSKQSWKKVLWIHKKKVKSCSQEVLKIVRCLTSPAIQACFRKQRIDQVWSFQKIQKRQLNNSYSIISWKQKADFRFVLT